MTNINNQDENQALNNSVEEVNNTEASPALDQTTEDVLPEGETTESADPEVSNEGSTETGQDESGKGAANRVRELANARRAEKTRADRAEAEAQSLRDRITQLTGEGQSIIGYQDPNVQDEPLIKPGEEIDTVELEKRLRVREQKLLQQADARSQLRQKQSEAVARLTNEAQKVVQEYPMLDPKSESYDPDLSDAISEATEAYISKSPYTASIDKFVSRLMKPYTGSVEKEVGKATEVIAKQASQAALRPTSIQAGKSAKEKTIAELEAELGIVQG